jgi:hypothetical protein
LGVVDGVEDDLAFFRRYDIVLEVAAIGPAAPDAKF